MSISNDEDEMFQTVLSYKNLSKEPSHHHVMMKDKTIIQFLAYSLDAEDIQIVKTALEALEFLIKNPINRPSIRSTFGVVEAIQVTSERLDLPSELKNLAKDLCKCVETQGPTISPYFRPKTSIITESQSEKRPPVTYTFHIFGLNSETRYDLENVLIRIKGVVSVLVDVDHLRCTVRAIPRITPEIIADTILTKTKMEAHLVVRNKNNQEVLKDILKENKGNERRGEGEERGGEGEWDKEMVDSILPEYLDEEDPPVKENSILTFDQLRTGATFFIRTAAELFQSSFYW